MWTLVLLFVASFIPYTASLVGNHFDNHLIEAIYGAVVIIMTIVNRHLHKVIDVPNIDQPE